MLHVILICTDEACAEEVEAWATETDWADALDALAELDALLCEGCGCALQAIAISAVEAAAPVTHLPRRSARTETRRAA